MTWMRKALQRLELYELVGIVVSLLAAILFFACGDALDAKQGEPGWHWHPVLWIWDIYRNFIPQATLWALGILLAVGFWRERNLKKGIRYGALMTLTVARYALPFCVCLIIYRALNFYIPLFSPTDRDNWLLASDAWMFGEQPSIWLQAHVKPWLSDYFSFVYMAWFPMIFLTLLLMLMKSRRAVAAFVTSALFSFYLGYVCYTLVPGVGPIYSLADTYTVSLTGGALTDMQNAVVSSDHDMAVPRDVFPSLHTALSCVMFYYIAKHRPRLLWFYAPMVGSILCSTIYLRYHYAIDVFAGILLAALTCYVGPRLSDRWRRWCGRDAESDEQPEERLQSELSAQ
jgi:membrane-associated phospholipid phosphatase